MGRSKPTQPHKGMVNLVGRNIFQNLLYKLRILSARTSLCIPRAVESVSRELLVDGLKDLELHRIRVVEGAFGEGDRQPQLVPVQNHINSDRISM